MFDLYVAVTGSWLLRLVAILVALGINFSFSSNWLWSENCDCSLNNKPGLGDYGPLFKSFAVLVTWLLFVSIFPNPSVVNLTFIEARS